MNHKFAPVYVLIITIAWANVTCLSGCKRSLDPGVDVAHATLVSFSQLKEATKNDPFFYFNGSDGSYHYFETKNGFYRMSSTFKMTNYQQFIDRMLFHNWKPGTMNFPVITDDDTILGYTGKTDWNPSIRVPEIQ
jgi:hypothetical protein